MCKGEKIMRKSKKILSLILVLVVCLIPMNVLAATGNGVQNQGIDISGKLVKVLNTYTGSEEWFIQEMEGKQHKLVGYLPAITEAFNTYSGLDVMITGNILADENSTIIVKQIDYVRYLGTCEKVLAGKLAYKYDSKDNCFKYTLTSIVDNQKYELKDINNQLDPSLAGKTIVVGGSIYPCPYFIVDKVYR